VAPGLAERLYGVTCYTQDLEYPAGVHGKCIGSNADDIPLQDGSVDFMCLHCTFEHFERQADTGFIREVARLLRPGGRVVILPLYLNRNYCNITGETNADTRATIGFDPDATHHCIIPEWANRFGRHYSPEALLARVWKPALEAGLAPELMRARNWDTVHPSLWLRWMLVLRQL
jgi:SAM-dependent methyltransferase